MADHLDFYSVFVYLTVFLFSLLFVALSERYLYEYNRTLKGGMVKLKGIVLLIIGILIPCLFAGFRGLNVGRDIDTYILNNFQYAKSVDDFFSYRNTMPVKVEILFSLLIYICSKINSMHLLLFVVELLIISPFAYVMVKLRGRGSLVLEFSLFYLLFYNFSLSGMRQSIAMGFLFLALFLFVKGKRLNSLFVVIVAILFHSSVLLICALILLCFFILKSKHWKLLVAIFCVFLFAMIPLFSFLVSKFTVIVSKVNPRYGFFIVHNFHSGFNFSDVPTTDILLKTLIILVPFLIMIKKKRNLFYDNLIIVFVLLGRYFVLFNGVFFESMRIAYYFDYLIPVFVSRSLAFVKYYSNKMIYSITAVFFAFCYWIYYIMYIGGYGTNLVEFNFSIV